MDTNIEYQTYEDILKSKVITRQLAGFEISDGDINPQLFDWQRHITRWGIRLGKAALFEECGLGKTPQQLEWARLVAEYTRRKVLILAPLAVAQQTIREGKKFGVDVAYCRSQKDARDCKEKIVVANYEMLEHFSPDYFSGVVLDESSILKAFTGATKRAILGAFEQTPYKLACTATPAPNDHLELGNHAEFLNIMRSNEMISRWFINDSMAAGNYRLKKHAVKDFWRWVTSWAVCISTPSDIGYSDEGFILPSLEIHEYAVGVDQTRAFKQTDKHGQRRIMLDANLSATNMWEEKRETAKDRVTKAGEITAGSQEPWIIWCDTNSEADLLIQAFPDAMEVRGSHSLKIKEERLNAFSTGQVSKIITKPDIAGFGLNWQHCPNQIFVGVTYSFEKTYQALRRSWRYGVRQPVHAHMIYAESEMGIMQVLTKKQAEFKEMQAQMNTAMEENGLYRGTDFREAKVNIENEVAKGRDWTLYLGDCVQVSRKLPDNSMDFSVFSPPFSTLYIYSDSIADMGNTSNHKEFFAQFDYLVAELFRITKPGRLCAVHCKDLPLYMNRDGAAGLYDFPGDLRASFEKFGWIYHSRVTIWKDPVIEMQRTKNHGLLWKNYSERGEVVRQGMADYLLVFRKWVDPDEMPDKQIQHKPIPGSYIGTNPPTSWDSDRDYSIQVWQKYASPVWYDIDQTNVLNFQLARENEDEKHICPLQLDVISRCIDLWTNPGEVVFSPFAGIGSEGYEAIRMKRRFVGIELKRSYFDIAARNLGEIEFKSSQPDLFAWASQLEEVKANGNGHKDELK